MSWLQDIPVVKWGRDEGGGAGQPKKHPVRHLEKINTVKIPIDEDQTLDVAYGPMGRQKDGLRE